MVFGSALGPGISGWLLDRGIGMEAQFAGFAIYFVFVLSVHRGVINQGVAFIVRYRPHARAGRNHHRTLDNCRAAFCIKERNQRFTGTQRLNGGFGINGRILNRVGRP